ncbi:MAG: hypothetical protein NTZ90_13570 [Proteobacteria bacterium]|nr:hypothetical protein [Pseudomonadota bacterium]
MDSNNVQEIIRRYRKPVIVAVGAMGAVLMLGVVGTGYAVYKTASFAADKLKSLEPGVSELPAQASGFVEGVVLNVASGWLQQGAASGKVAKVKNGLSCFDALGGPSPTEIVGYVQRTITDATLTTQLQDLNKSLSGSTTTANGPAACTSWLLNG